MRNSIKTVPRIDSKKHFLIFERKKKDRFRIPMLLPERFPKMLPLNGGFRYPASVICVTVSKMQTVIKTITIDDTDRFANSMIWWVYLFYVQLLKWGGKRRAHTNPSVCFPCCVSHNLIVMCENCWQLAICLFWIGVQLVANCLQITPIWAWLHTKKSFHNHSRDTIHKKLKLATYGVGMGLVWCIRNYTN